MTLTSSALGSAKGVYWVGTAGGESGSYRAAFLGSIAGCAVGCGSYAIWLYERCCFSGGEFTIATALAFLTHSVGGTIAFNLAKKKSSRFSSR